MLVYELEVQGNASGIGNRLIEADPALDFDVVNLPEGRRAFRIFFDGSDEKEYEKEMSILRNIVENIAVIKSRDSAIRDLAMMGEARKLGAHAQSNTGGIDFTSDKALTVQNNGQDIKFHLDPAQMAQWQNAPGVTFEIVDFKAMPDIRSWLGIGSNLSLEILISL